MTKNYSIDEILEKLNFSDDEKRIFTSSIRETKLAQSNDEIDARAEIFEMIKEEYK